MLQKQYRVFFAFLFFLSSCAVTLPGGSSSGSGTTASVPIYQGMTVGKLSNSNNLQSQKSQGAINQDNPFGLPNNEIIEHRIESDLANLLEEETMDYYASPSEVVRITINILNPQSYVILSFNLNGRRYQSFEFREGSTSTRLLMDVTLQNSPGIQSLTIDEIKYIVDSGGDNQIRDVVMFGDQTVEVGIGYNQLPIVNMVSQTILPTTVNYAIEVSDPLNILSTQETAIYFYFFDGKTLQKEVLKVGNNDLEFNKLTSKTLYQYALVSALNPLDGEGPVLTYHNQEAFLTSNFIQLSVISTKESISYEVSVMNGLESGVINRVEIEKNSEIIGTQENSIGSFVELLSNNEYALNVYYDYSHEGETELFTEVYSLAASTLAKSTPTFSFTDVVAGKEDVTFEYEVTDLDEVGVLSRIELLKGEEVVETLTEFEDTSFANLLSNNDYQLKATYTYDLNDGEGSQTIVITNLTKTLPKSTPTFSFTDVVAGKEDVTFEYEVTDLDEVGSLAKVELFKDDVILETFTSFDSLFLEGLLSNNQYLLKAYYEVDLNDGLGLQTLVFNQDFTTLPKSTPTFSFTDVVAGKEDVTFEYEVTDLDEVGVLSRIELLKGEEVVETLTEFEDTSFANLLSNNDYQLKATYTYDLNDGEGEQSQSVTFNIKTSIKILGLTNLTEIVSTSNSIRFDVNLIDPDNSINLQKVRIFLNNLLIEEQIISSMNPIIFSNLNPITLYKVTLIYLVDLNDGNEEINASKDYSIYTQPEEISILTAEVLNEGQSISTSEEIILKITFLNPSAVRIKGIYINNELYEITFPRSDYVIVYIDGFEDGGTKNFEINSIISTFDIQEFESNIVDLFSFSFIVFSKVYVTDIYNEFQNYDLTSSTTFFINIKNENNYEIRDVEIMFNDYSGFESYKYSLEIISNNKISFRWVNENIARFWRESLNTITIKSITYGLQHESDINQLIDYSEQFFGLYGGKYEISSIDDLKNIQYGNSFVLTQDLDFSNITNWNPLQFFNSSLDGKGFKIKNFSSSKPLFIQFTGVIINTNFENINLVSNENVSGYGFFGQAVVGSIFENNNFDIDLITNKTHSYLGGIAGQSINSMYYKNQFNTNIFSSFNNNSEVSLLGGVFGSSQNSVFMKNIINSEIQNGYKTNQNIGGLLGSSYYDDFIANSINTIISSNNLNLDNTEGVGIFAGTSQFSNVLNNLLVGEFSISTKARYLWAGGVIGNSNENQINGNLLNVKGFIDNTHPNANYVAFGVLMGFAGKPSIGVNLIQYSVTLSQNVLTRSIFYGETFNDTSEIFNNVYILENSLIIKVVDGVSVSQFLDFEWNKYINLSGYDNLYLFKTILDWDLETWNLINADIFQEIYPELNPI
jgi:hypothetical protein